jgi:SAM-dependent methyltransferase
VSEAVGMSEAVIWHDVECGSYAADLPLWRQLASHADGPILDLGAGTGRVALDLAAAGHAVTALDSDPVLLAALAARSRERGLDVRCVEGDARRRPALGRFALVVAAMQFVQIMGGTAARAELLAGVADCLDEGGRFAAALAELDGAIAPEDALPPVPDVGERDGWVYSSLPLDVRPEPGGVAVERLRQRVSPGGDLAEERHTQLLDSLTPAQFESEVAAHGLRAVEWHRVPATADHVGSMVAVCRR